METSAPPRNAVLAVVCAALLRSSGGLFIKIAPFGPLGVACGRALVTTLFYLLVLRPNLRGARISTGLVYAAMIVTFVSATKLTTAANAIFLQYTGPAYVLALSPFLLREPFERLDGYCVALSLGGMALFFVGRVEPGQFWGNVLGALSGIAYALTIVLLRRDAKEGARDAMPSTVLGNLIAAVITLPFAASGFASITVQGALVLLYLGVVQMGIAYLLLAKGLRFVPAAEASLISMLEPTLNPVWVYLGTGERPGPWSVVGGVIVLAAVTVRALAKGSPAPATASRPR
ncbi:MAG: EamA/RhaT family transporter [Deltaproteobacteria bacterium]|nr:MAG: EamA/RhaT family transporter [Deltaproteobacteria bacterium]